MTNSILNLVNGSPSYATQTASASNTADVAYGSNICGPTVFAITTTTSVTALSNTEITINSVTGTISLYTANTAAVGTHTATVTASLPNYSAIPPGTATFTITINSCIVTSFTMSTLSDQTYYIPNSALTWSIVGSSVFSYVPACGYSVVLTSSATPSFLSVTTGSTLSYSA